MDTPNAPVLSPFVRFMTGPQGERFAEILGLDPKRLSRNAAILIEADCIAVARVEIRLTPDELNQITAMLTEGAA